MSMWNFAQSLTGKTNTNNTLPEFQLQNLESRELYSADGLLITEFLASNKTSITDSDGHNSDWIEIYNSTDATINLNGVFLTDNQNDLNQWQFPDIEINANEYIIVFASNKNRSVDKDDLHTNFKLSTSGEFLALVDTDGSTIVDQFTPTYPQQLRDYSYGRTSTDAAVDTKAYYASPTPGAQNYTTPLYDIGPSISNVTKNINKPTDSQDLIITAQVDQLVDPIASVTLHYRIMFENELTLIMVDNGTNNDAVAGDGIYTGTISHTLSDQGEMVRWYVTAKDTENQISRGPIFPGSDLNDFEAPQYYGTVILSSANYTREASIDWFIRPGFESQANTSSGTRASVNYNGEFYDNVFIRRRGASSAGLPKKSYKIDFNSGHHFRFHEDYKRVSEININTDYPDKTYMRQTLAFETYAILGATSSIAFPMRINRNGTFYMQSTFVEQPDEDLIERNGLDPDGNLYKMYNPATSAGSSAQHKSGTATDKTELADLIYSVNNLTGSALNNYLFDKIDIPLALNYLVASAMVQQTDASKKNYYLYQDTHNTGRWSFLPWDEDMTFGKHWIQNASLLTDELWADVDSVTRHGQYQEPSHPLAGTEERRVDNQYNRIIDALLNNAQFTELYLRRLRSAMDQLLLSPEANATEQNYYEQRMQHLNATINNEVYKDRAKWGWYGLNQPLATAMNALVTQYLDVRRQHFYVNHSVNNPSFPDNAGIPDQQVANAVINFGTIDFRPTSGNQKQEYIQFTNPSNQAIDISGWTVTGGITHTFQQGSIIPANGSFYLTADFASFLLRTTGPSGGQGLVIQDGYQGSLSNFGEALTLKNSDGTVISTITTAVDPTDAQKFLRISEINYNPSNTNPLAGESELADNDDYEYIELINTSTDTPLNLANVNISGDIEFTFPTASTTLFTTQFENGADGFTYVPDAFANNTTSYNGQTSGLLDPLNGINNSGSLKVRMETGNYSNRIYGESGGFTKTFTLATATTIRISLDSRLVLDGGHESNEYGETIIQINGVNYGTNDNSYISRIYGNGTNNPSNDPTAPDDAGWVKSDFTITLPAGEHSMLIGAYMSRSDSPTRESLTAYFDNISIEEYSSTGYVLQPGQRVLIVANRQRFEQRYGTGIEIAGQYTKLLKNSGGTIKLDDNENSTIIEYKVPTAGLSDGSGLTLLPQNNTTTNTVDGYIISDVFGGTPGQGEQVNTLTPGSVIINEVLAHTDIPQVDLIELKNTTDQPIDISGFFISDSDNVFAFQIPAGTTIPANGFITFSESDFAAATDTTNPLHDGFRLSSEYGETLTLFTNGDAIGVGTRPTYVDHASFGASYNGQTLGRPQNDITGDHRLYTLENDTISTPGQNAKHLVSPVIITEVNYNPTSNINDDNLEFIELYNHTDTAVNISGWRLDNAVEFLFPVNTIIQAKTTILIVKFAADNTESLNAFNAAYNIPAGTLILFDYTGKLNSEGERLQLERPDTPSTVEPFDIPYIVADEINYNDAQAWADANGSGNSLNRTQTNAFGNNANSWNAATPTPGTAAFTPPTPGDINEDGTVNNDDLNLVKTNFGSGFSLADLFNVRNNFTPPTAAPAPAIIQEQTPTPAAAIIPDAPTAPAAEQKQTEETKSAAATVTQETTQTPSTTVAQNTVAQTQTYQLLTQDNTQEQTEVEQKATLRTTSQSTTLNLLDNEEESLWLI